MMKKPWSKVINSAFIWIVIALLLTGTGPFFLKASAQNSPASVPPLTPVPAADKAIEVVNPYLQIEHRTLTDGTQFSKYLINGPSKRPSGSESQAELSSSLSTTAVVLPSFPSYKWVFGCSAVSASMIAAYQDRGAYPNIYTGPTNGGVMPLSDTTWSTWSDKYDTYPNNPLIASHFGLDGWTTLGSIDDYWLHYGSVYDDPYLTGDWSQHTWGTAIGDYMKTSQSAFDNPDGATGFWIPDGNTKLTCNEMESYEIEAEDGTYGRKLFYEARGYTVTDCYTQNTDNFSTGGFSLEDFQEEIDAGYPVLLNLAGHSVVGYGYDGSTIYIRDTWDNNPNNLYTMPWGGSYDGMELIQVSIVHLAPAPETFTNKLFLPIVNKFSPINENAIINGDFESGNTAWTEYSSNDFVIIMKSYLAELEAHSGEWIAWLGGWYDEDSSISQTVTVPMDMSYLHYWYFINSEDTCGNAYFWIKVNNAIVTTKQLCTTQNTNNWVEGVADLSNYAGKTITLKFDVSTGSDFYSNLFLDDIYFSNSAIYALSGTIGENQNIEISKHKD